MTLNSERITDISVDNQIVKFLKVSKENQDALEHSNDFTYQALDMKMKKMRKNVKWTFFEILHCYG